MKADPSEPMMQLMAITRGTSHKRMYSSPSTPAVRVSSCENNLQTRLHRSCRYCPRNWASRQYVHHSVHAQHFESRSEAGYALYGQQTSTRGHAGFSHENNPIKTEKGAHLVFQK